MREVDDGYELRWRDCSVPREAPPVPLYNRPGPGCPRSVTKRSWILSLLLLSLRGNLSLFLLAWEVVFHRVLVGSHLSFFVVSPEWALTCGLLMGFECSFVGLDDNILDGP